VLLSTELSCLSSDCSDLHAFDTAGTDPLAPGASVTPTPATSRPTAKTRTTRISLPFRVRPSRETLYHAGARDACVVSSRAFGSRLPDAHPVDVAVQREHLAHDRVIVEL
jgi:hypothetical protein